MPDNTTDVDVPDGFDVGTIDDAIVDESDTKTVWVKDEDNGIAYWFEMQKEIPLRKKNEVLERNLTTEQGPDGNPQQNLSSDYYTDLLQHMVVDWFGSDEDNDDVPSLTVFLNKMSSVFEDLQDEVPPPFEALPDGERGK